uniref:Odorant receptor n=1 Tax=Leucinodes orbonalis TaxID=711050 RepID=A0AAU0QLM8_9NEOP|nr:odorant receptor [Leucinodes orbonalis]
MPSSYGLPKPGSPFLVFLGMFWAQAAAGASLEIVCYFSLNALIGVNVMNIKALFIILETDLENAIEDNELVSFRLDLTDTDNVSSYKKISNIIKRHQKILRICNEINDVFSLTIFVDVTCAATAIGFYGFVLITEPDIPTKILHFFRMVSVSLTIFIYTWPAEVLSEANADLAQAAYNSLWYISDVRSRRLILLIMHRSVHPVYLKALSFWNIRLETYSKIVSSAYSYISVLSTANN